MVAPVSWKCVSGWLDAFRGWNNLHILREHRHLHCLQLSFESGCPLEALAAKEATVKENILIASKGKIRLFSEYQSVKGNLRNLKFRGLLYSTMYNSATIKCTALAFTNFVAMDVLYTHSTEVWLTYLHAFASLQYTTVLKQFIVLYPIAKTVYHMSHQP